MVPLSKNLHIALRHCTLDRRSQSLERLSKVNIVPLNALRVNCAHVLHHFRIGTHQHQGAKDLAPPLSLHCSHGNRCLSCLQNCGLANNFLRRMNMCLFQFNCLLSSGKLAVVSHDVSWGLVIVDDLLFGCF